MSRMNLLEFHFEDNIVNKIFEGSSLFTSEGGGEGWLCYWWVGWANVVGDISAWGLV